MKYLYIGGAILGFFLLQSFTKRNALVDEELEDEIKDVEESNVPSAPSSPGGTLANAGTIGAPSTSSPPEYITINGKKVSLDTCNVMDRVYQDLKKPLFYRDPLDKVFAVADWSKGKLWTGIVYWNDRYKWKSGLNLYEFYLRAFKEDMVQAQGVGDARIMRVALRIKSFGWQKK